MHTTAAAHLRWCLPTHACLHNFEKGGVSWYRERRCTNAVYAGGCRAATISFLRSNTTKASGYGIDMRIVRKLRRKELVSFVFLLHRATLHLQAPINWEADMLSQVLFQEEFLSRLDEHPVA
eukprot:826625-Pleurochrysis_carterae.AAC.2